VGKVLNDGGSGRELDILEGMNWAIDNKCCAISMSLGRQVAQGEKPDPMYEVIWPHCVRSQSSLLPEKSARDFGDSSGGGTRQLTVYYGGCRRRS
jgi:hypothetical protein